MFLIGCVFRFISLFSIRGSSTRITLIECLKSKRPSSNHRFGFTDHIGKACYEGNSSPCLMKNIHSNFGFVIHFHVPNVEINKFKEDKQNLIVQVVEI
ncbi:hypothetical protein psyc5s11_39360 [Clostridium gelidum]|uniref:Secreted protein n=1 Tax=Clostridium gelidum TaxID=704125 RepID=A0ABM7T9R7_9CLOT|nr:hypothetical protein psyc5s11_39360 [Clostridium gelidum]